ncbi:MAG: hypothetical protein ACJAUP_001241 [Cellvibrionaceae bacterium]|jgi:hypothetical protein
MNAYLWSLNAKKPALALIKLFAINLSMTVVIHDSSIDQ